MTRTDPRNSIVLLGSVKNSQSPSMPVIMLGTFQSFEKRLREHVYQYKHKVRERVSWDRETGKRYDTPLEKCWILLNRTPPQTMFPLGLEVLCLVSWVFFIEQQRAWYCDGFIFRNQCTVELPHAVLTITLLLRVRSHFALHKLR